MKRLNSKIIAFTTLFISAFSASAENYSNMYVFGDSLSDTGNLQAVTQDPAIPGRFTNGPVAAEVIANALGLTLTNSYHLLGGALPFGNNYAIAGAKSVDEDGDESTPDINLPTQVNAFLQIHGGNAPADALYVILIGGNDIRAARGIRAAGLLANTQEERRAARQAANESLQAAVDSEKAQIMKLITSGAKHIMVVNAPDIGAIPETDLVASQLMVSAENKSEQKKVARLPAITSKLSAKYNQKLARKIGQIERQSGINIVAYDLLGFLTEQIDAAEDFGYSNVDDACIYVFSAAGAVNPECADFPTASGFLFWDEIHPTTKAHQNAGIDIVQMLLGN
jgi:phospholipase/lecithinase/hemolysin